MARAPLVSAARYGRTLPVSCERIWENVLDWEHLPWLHRDAFASVELIEESAGGWRAAVRGRPEPGGAGFEIEVKLDRPGLRYLSRTLSGPGAGSEIWTDLEPLDEHETRIRVEFLVPGPLAGESLRSLGRAHVRLYARLWDEDEQMMVRRARLLEAARERRAGESHRDLGNAARLRCELPLEVDVAGDTFRVVELGGELFAYPTACPHRGGPLSEAPDPAGVVSCPWHGYRFDVRTGRSADGRSLCFSGPLRVLVDPETDTARLEVG